MRSPARWYVIATILVALVNIAYYDHYTAHLVGPPSGRTFEGLVLGNLGFAAMIGALLYSVRRRFLSRAMNAIRVDPDVRRKIKEGERTALEQLQNLQRQVMQNASLTVSAVRRQASAILRQTGMKRFLYAQVDAGPGGRGVRLAIGRREWGGRLQTWYYWHLMLGLLSILLILTHAGFRFGNLVAVLALICLIGVVATGTWGYIIYQLVPTALTKVEERVEKTPEELRDELQEVTQELETIIQGKSQLFNEIYQQETAIPGVSLKPSWRWLWAPAEIARDTTRPDRLRLIVKEIPGTEQEDFRQMVRLLFQKEKLEVSLYPQLRYDYLLKIWLSLHIPLTAGLMIFSLIHIVSILYY
ncbi:MAG: hypothetical protein FJ147_00670 [Deltaproteobacteria bacterium]|nr:hypothetical protein [Deltaproteobacteria bacterium]